MKKILLKSVAVISAVLLAAGCIEETFPVGSTITKDQMAQADEPLQAKLGAITAALHKFNVAGYYSGYGVPTDFGLPAIHIMTEHMLEDMVATSPGYNHFSVYNSNQAQGDTYIYCAYFWDCYYPWIFATNEVIGFVENPEEADKSVLASLGQAHAYRAMFYLDLGRLFEFKENDYTTASDAIKGLTVPIVTEKTTTEEATNNPRVSREVLYKFILEDLKKAETYLAGTSLSYNTPSLAAVYGLYARAYIEMGYWEGTDWEQLGVDGLTDNTKAFELAEQYAAQAIEESGKTPLTQSQWEDPSKGFNSGASNNAWIWGIPVVSDNLNNVSAWATWMSSETQWSYGMLNQFGASKSFYEKISDSDFRKHSWLDPDMTDYYDYNFAGTAEDQAYFLKYANPYANLKFRPGNGNCVDYNTGNATDHALMRVEEMYFIRMEANVGRKNLSGARELLNEFMTYRITDGSYDCTSKTPSEESFIREMMFQKRVEFWGEGILIYDYKRLDQPITRGYEGSNHVSSYMFNTTGRSPQWNIVITRGEIQANSGITDALNNPDPSEIIPVWSN